MAKDAKRHVRAHKAKRPAPRPSRAPRRPGRRLLGGLIASIALVGFLLLGVFPTRTYLAQRADTRESSAQLRELKAQNARLDARIERLRTPSEVERIARAEYGLVRPGEQSYALLPTPPPPVKLPEVWPFVGVADELNR